MEKKQEPAKPKAKPVVEVKKAMEFKLEGDYLVIKVPRKELTKKLLAELLN